MKIGIFYGSSTCYTAMVAERMRDLLAPHEIDLCDLRSERIEQCCDYDYLIFGIPTWDFGELQEDWRAQWLTLSQIDFRGKKVALYGLGDQVGYAEWFLDALGALHDLLLNCGAELYGYWPNQGYQFIASKALSSNGDYFVGLALDEANQYRDSEARIQQWIAQLQQLWFEE